MLYSDKDNRKNTVVVKSKNFNNFTTFWNALTFNFKAKTDFKMWKSLVGFLLLGLLFNPGFCLEDGLKIDQTLEKLNANSSFYIDEILSKLRQILVESGYGQIKLPNTTSSFSESFLGIKWHGEASAYDGLLRGMETIHREGAASLVVKNDEIVVSTDLGFDNVNVTYNLKARFMGYGPKARVIGHFKHIKCYLEAKTSLQHPSKVTLTQFNIHDIGKLKFDITGLGSILDYAAEGLSGAIGNLVKSKVADVIENNIKDLLNDLLRTIKLPSDDILL